MTPTLANPLSLGDTRSQVQQFSAWLETDIPEAMWDKMRSEGLIHPDAPTELLASNTCTPERH
jgi:D-threo-aldose 1-dehydrogenase